MKISKLAVPSFLKGFRSGIKKKTNYIISSIGKFLFKRWIVKKDFCIFSNDCYGGEIYRWLNLSYNTPFIGLMIMAPCYIKLLKNPKYYLELPLKFINTSKYADMINLKMIKDYPIAMLGDVEIHFLHYKSSEEAIEKWNRRAARINWDKIKVKFAMDKDYSTPELLDEFEGLPYESKICFSKQPYPKNNANFQIDNYTVDGAALFRSTLKHFSIVNWLNNNEPNFLLKSDKLKGILLYNSLKR